jgi:tRNA (cytidine/uridine-2'-O-)-methyltransferase
VKIVVYQPQIPQNTGNIVRTCAVTGNDLILVRPLGFSTNNRWLKRSSLDYWEGVKVEIIDDLERLLERIQENFYFFSSKATKNYTTIPYCSDDYLIFGSETEGLPQTLMKKWFDRVVTIPMMPQVRCLNLATSVGIVIYEAWRQQGFLVNNR